MAATMKPHTTHLMTQLTVLITLPTTIPAVIRTTITTQHSLAITHTTTTIIRTTTIATTTLKTMTTNKNMVVTMMDITAITTPITIKETYSQIPKRKRLRTVPKPPFLTRLVNLLSTVST